MRTTCCLLLLLAGIPACTSTVDTSDPPMDIVLDNLVRMPLADEFTPEREVVISYVEIPPNTTMDWHWHPGEEFHYYLEGKVTIAIDDHEEIHGTPGTVGHVPYRARHTAITGDEGAKAIVFRIHTEGEPVRYLDSGAAADQ